MVINSERHEEGKKVEKSGGVAERAKMREPRLNFEWKRTVLIYELLCILVPFFSITS